MRYAYIWYIIAASSVVLYILMGTDKLRAKKQKRRIPEKVLFLFAILGGAFGGALAMYGFRHKTKHWYFALFSPLLALIQLGGAFYLTLR